MSEFSRLLKRIEITGFYDLYFPLLTGKQREIFELHEIMDLSLSEISEKLGITRQGAHDVLNRSFEKLLRIEEQLGFSSKLKTRKEQLSRLQSLLEEYQEQIPKDFSERALSIIEETKGEL